MKTAVFEGELAGYEIHQRMKGQVLRAIFSRTRTIVHYLSKE